MIHIDYKNFEKEFLATDIGKQILSEYTHVTCSNESWPSVVVAAARWDMTPRQLTSDPFLTLKDPKFSTFSIVPFFYINQLLEKNPKEIIDIGCGWNIFKKYFPIITGIDCIDPYADIKDKYDSNFISQHEQQFESIMSINLSWHMGPNGEATNLLNLTDHVVQFSRLLAPGGRCFLSISSLGIMKYTPREWFTNNNLSPFDIVPLSKYIESLLLNTNLNIRCLDLELDTLYNLPNHDGEIRIVFDR